MEEAGYFTYDHTILQVVPSFPVSLLPDESAGKKMTRDTCTVMMIARSSVIDKP
ncbi:MAG: hypothetical protein JSV13_04305 [Nitrospiraceae bacterium]|nr:MAG: hypothetical protein JSV13_04305 [Nitrospiraceae bacterium]